jgi:hypothetical protein
MKVSDGEVSLAEDSLVRFEDSLVYVGTFQNGIILCILVRFILTILCFPPTFIGTPVVGK